MAPGTVRGCWEQLAPELESRGHQVVVVNLPCEDTTATCETYARIAVDALEAEDVKDVVVVGHSLGGFHDPACRSTAPRQQARHAFTTE